MTPQSLSSAWGTHLRPDEHAVLAALAAQSPVVLAPVAPKLEWAPQHSTLVPL